MAQAAIRAEVNYVDVCDDPGPVETLLSLDEAARHAGIALVTGVGWTPGVTNLLAIKGAAELDAVHEIKVAWVGSSADSTGLAVIMHLFHAISGEAPMYQDGAWIQAAAGSGEEVIEFPAPLGQVAVSHCGHPEPLTLPRYMSVRTVSVKGGLVPSWNNAMARGLARLGLIGTSAKIRRVARLVHSFEGILRLGGVRASGARVDVIGNKDGEPRTVSYAATAPMGRLTGIPAATCARWLAAGRLPTGAYAPEGCLDHEAFLAELSERGITCQRMA
jgi:saccharopine dehydrogenase-like NADP-dependent oxidoreductase